MWESKLIMGCLLEGDLAKKEKARSKSQGDKKMVRCFVCHEEGHIKNDFPKRKKM